MPTLELLIDATGMQRGAAVAKTALDSVTATAGKTATEVQRAGSNLSGAFQLTGGGVQIASGISQTAKAFGELNTAAGLFNASRTLLEIGNTARDFQQLRGAVGGAATVFGTLGAVIRANPIGAVATAIGIAATAFAAFSSGAKQAATDYRALADEVQKAGLESAAKRILGNYDPTTETQARQRAIEQAIAGLQGGAAAPNFQDLSRITGIGNVDLARVLASAGNVQARQYLREGAFNRPVEIAGSQGQFAFPSSSDLGNLPINSVEATEVLRRAFSSPAPSRGSMFPSSSVIPSNAASIEDSLARSLVGRPGFGGFGRGIGGGLPGLGTPFNAEEQARNEQSIARYNAMLEEQAQRLERAAAAGEQFGQAIGGALFDAISGANTLRGALASVFQSLARQGFQQGVGGIFGAVVKGITGAQAAQNGGSPGPGSNIDIG